MGTRATIRFKDDYEEYYIYVGCDGFPENVLSDLKRVIDKKKDSWSGSECGTLVSCFLGEMHEPNKRIPFYELTTDWHGDETYKYTVYYNIRDGVWEYDVI